MNPVSCPQCGRAAQIYDRFTLGSTSGVIEHAKTRCPEGHWFTVPAEDLRPYQPTHLFEAAPRRRGGARTRRAPRAALAPAQAACAALPVGGATAAVAT